ncbi:MAG: response regulator transcription factor [Mycoplasmatales bacterium]
MIKILVVEDETSLQQLISEVLKSNGYTVFCANNGVEGYELYMQETFDLVITDVMMPNMDGHQFVKLIRSKDTEIPIMLLTALGEEEDEVHGFDIGANDYISKPFSFKIFQKRVTALLKTNKKIHDEIIRDELRIVLNSREVFHNGNLIDLTVKEYDLLVYLIENEGHVLSREQMLEKVWGYTYDADMRNIDTHIKNIRKKLQGIQIKTVMGIGYRYG